MNLKFKLGCEVAKQISLAFNGDQCRDVVTTVMNFRVL